MDKYREGMIISKEQTEWLDFTLDKTQTAFYETGKKFEKLFATYLTLLGVAAILTYSRVVGTESGTNDVKVPFIELALDRRYAAIAIIVLGTGVLLSLVCSIVYEELLRWRTEGLILVRYGEISEIGDVPDDKYWYLRNPSLFRMSLFLAGAYPPGQVFTNIFLTIFLAGLILPSIFTWHLAGDLRWSLAPKVLITAAVSILPALSAFLLITLFPRSRSVAAVYEQLYNYFKSRK